MRNDLFEGEVNIEQMDFVKYGTVDSWLRSKFFDLSQACNFDSKYDCRSKTQQINEDSSKADVEEVHIRLTKYLPAHDEFWIRWTYYAEKFNIRV